MSEEEPAADREGDLNRALDEEAIEVATELAWTWNRLANKRGIAHDRMGALSAAESAVEAIRPLAVRRGVGSQGVQDLVYLLTNLARRFHAVGRTNDALLALVEAKGWQIAQMGNSPELREEAMSTLSSLNSHTAAIQRALGDTTGALDSIVEAILFDVLATQATPDFSTARLRHDLSNAVGILDQTPSR